MLAWYVALVIGESGLAASGMLFSSNLFSGHSYTVSNIKDLFTNVAGDKLLAYLKHVGLYSRI